MPHAMTPDSGDESDRDFGEGSIEDLDLESLNGGSDFYDAELEANYLERFNRASQDIRKRGGFASEHDVEEFLRQYDNIANKSVAKAGGNLLHALVDVVKHTDELRPKGVELLVRRMVESWPSLLGDVDRDGHNPVFAAIRNSQHELANYMISACKDASCLDIALSTKDQTGMTCLHLAFKENINADTTRMLVESASNEALAVQDNSGNTPMHYAVSFVQCTDPRAELIGLLLDRDLEALQNGARSQPTFLDLRAGESGRSVYMEHQATRAPLSKAYADHLSSKAQGAGAGKQGQTGAASSAAGPGSAPSGLRDGARDLRQGAAVSAELNGDGGTDRYCSNVNGDSDESSLGARGRLRQGTNNDEAEDQAVEEIRGPEDRAGNANRRCEPWSDTGLQQHGTMGFESHPEQENGKTSRAVRPGPYKDMIERLGNSDAILLRLKLHYMRTRSAEMVLSFLYGTNIDNVQICFDYDQLPRKVSWNEFLKRFGADAKSGLGFDRVLQYVTIPRVEVVLKGRQADREREAETRSGVRQVGPLGRKDMQYFFDWLYKKGVRHIIRVVVEDSGDSGEKVHSDRAIGESLERFVVEHLDWNKTDLDPETILRVSSKVERKAPTPEDPGRTEIVPDRQLRGLKLKWSGSNAVLRAWSEPEGLALLPHLEQIFLLRPPADKTYDSEPWIKAKVEDFQARLHASQQQAARAVASILGVDDIDGAFKRVKLRLVSEEAMDTESKPMSHDALHSTASAPVNGGQPHRWLDSTARFAGEMIPFWQSTVNDFVDSRQDGRTIEGLENDVVLALIDDGVDIFDIPPTNQILEGKSFDFHAEKVRPPFSSAKGHGTVMASMILRVCPMAKVYPIRLKTYDNPEGKNMEIDAGYAAQAIQAALDKKATIICMPWTIPMARDGNESEGEKLLHNVLEAAVDHRVLMFCSAPDEGKFVQPDYYPSGPWRDRFFRIGAAGADGTVFRWTAEDDLTYIVPGVDVIRERGAASSLDARTLGGIPNHTVETGSDVATALAAGLAAMVIYCVKASVLAIRTAHHNHGPLLGIPPDEAADLIAHPEEMKRAFASLGRVTPNKFVQVWDELDDISEQLEILQTPTPTAETKQESVAAFVDFGLKLWSAAKYGR